MLRKQWSRILEAAVVLAAAALLAFFPAKASAAAVSGVQLCLRSVIPSLFPFFVVSGLMLSLLHPAAGETAAGRLFTRMFGLPGGCLPVFLLGLVGGYPVGASSAASLYAAGGCNREEAERLLLFANNCGPAFILGMLSGVLQSIGAAWLLLLVHWACSIWLGLLLGAGREPSTRTAAAPQHSQRPGLASALTTVIVSGGRSALRVCAYVIFFSVFTRLLPASALLRGIWELTGGILCLERCSPLHGAIAAFLLGFGGLAVFCQTTAAAGECGLSTARYLPYRFLHGALSALLAGSLLWKPFLAVFPLSAAVLSLIIAKRSRKKGQHAVY